MKKRIQTAGGNNGNSVLSQSVENLRKRRINPWSASHTGHRRCTGEPGYLKDTQDNILRQNKSSFGRFM